MKRLYQQLGKELTLDNLVFTSVEGSPITQKCEDSVICGGGFDTGGSDTFHYTTRLTASTWLAIEIGALTQPAKLRRKAMASPLVQLLLDLTSLLFQPHLGRRQVIHDQGRPHHRGHPCGVQAGRYFHHVHAPRQRVLAELPDQLQRLVG